MREIEFRCWDTFNKQWLKTPEGDIDCFISPYIDKRTPQYKLMQYTGLKDKNGKKIFEGDIVKFKYKGILLPKGVIRYVIDRFLIDATIHYSISNNFDLDHIEIIGNIYENSNLMEK